MKPYKDEYQQNEVRFGSHGAVINISTSDLRLSNPVNISEIRVETQNGSSLLETTGSKVTSNRQQMRQYDPVNMDYEPKYHLKSMIVKPGTKDSSLLSPDSSNSQDQFSQENLKLLD